MPGYHSAVRIALTALTFLALTGCKEEFSEYQQNPIAGTWSLQSVEGMAGCTATSGTLSVIDVEDMPLTGDFTWAANCIAGNGISEAGDIQSIETDEWGVDYGVDILLHTPNSRALDWDCSMNDPEMTCIESGVQVVVFEFTRAGEN
jgi:hypothetical protein